MALKNKKEKEKKNFFPEEGLRVIKSVSENLKNKELNYQLKGEVKVLNFVEHELFNLIPMLSDEIMFEVTRENEIIFFEHGMTDFDFHTRYLVRFSMEMITDNILNIDFIYDKVSSDIFVLHLIRTIEYIFNIVIETQKEIVNRYDIIHKEFNSEEFLGEEQDTSLTSIMMTSPLVKARMAEVEEFRKAEEKKEMELIND